MEPIGYDFGRLLTIDSINREKLCIKKDAAHRREIAVRSVVFP